MTHARIYQQGVKAFLDAKPLGSNPYDSSVNSEAHEAWKDGWLDANHSRLRCFASLAAIRRYMSKPQKNSRQLMLCAPSEHLDDWASALGGRLKADLAAQDQPYL